MRGGPPAHGNHDSARLRGTVLHRAVCDLGAPAFHCSWLCSNSMRTVSGSAGVAGHCSGVEQMVEG
jgi:hypothetical protein